MTHSGALPESKAGWEALEDEEDDKAGHAVPKTLVLLYRA
jgi:hypothetical protein